MKSLNMKTLVAGAILAGLIAVAGCSKTQQLSQQPGSAGPNGGDLVSIKGGTAYAEVMANAGTGELMVHTLDRDLKSSRPIEMEPITVGSDGRSVELTPQPTESDPSGTSSRFYGRADWMRGGNVRHGWMQGRGTGDKQEFEWKHGWEAGRMHWQEAGGHRGMGSEHESEREGGGMMGR